MAGVQTGMICMFTFILIIALYLLRMTIFRMQDAEIEELKAGHERI